MTATHLTIAEGARFEDVQATAGEADPAAGIIEARILDTASRQAVIHALDALRDHVLAAAWPNGTERAD